MTPQATPPLVPLTCTQCGGQLKAKPGTYVELQGGGFFYHGGEKLKCESCGTEFLPNTQVMPFTGGVNIQINGDVSGNLVFGNGNIING